MPPFKQSPSSVPIITKNEENPYEVLTNESALILLEQGKSEIIADYIHRDYLLAQEAEYRDMEIDFENERDGLTTEKRSRHFNSFSNDIAVKLIEAGEGYAVAESINYFKNISDEVIIKLVESGYGLVIEDYVSSNSSGLSNNVVAKYKELAIYPEVLAPKRWMRNY